MPTYTAYGLSIQSELSLPELKQVHTKSDVCIRLGQAPTLSAKSGAKEPVVMITERGVVLYWREIGAFYVQNGEEIVVDPAPGVDESRVRLFLLGAAIGMLLHQRGFAVFHASAVAINGSAALFLGDKGWGKSTMAAVLRNRGYDILADDVVAIDFSSRRPTVLPGFPQLKLWPDSLAFINQSAATLPRLHPDFEKRDYHVATGFSDQVTPLQAIYILADGPAPAIEPAPAVQSLLALLPHWYCTRFGAEVLQNLNHAVHFLQCTRVADAVPVYHLRRPRRLSAIAEAAHLVAEQVGCNG